MNLVYKGGADLWFRDASGTKRRALRGVPFEADQATAEILLRDPAVTRAEPVAVLRAVDLPPATLLEAAKLEEMTHAELIKLAGAMGQTLKARDTNPVIIAAIRAAQAAAVAPAPAAPVASPDPAPAAPEAKAGDQADDEDLRAKAEAEAAVTRPGTITLDDLPASGRITQG
jgi:hypothetical protein